MTYGFSRPAWIQELNTSASEDRFTIRDVLLIVLTGSSGAVDAISYFGLGKIFSAFMTGNIVFLGFAIADLVIVALASFSVGPIWVRDLR